MIERQQTDTDISVEVEREALTSAMLDQLLERLELSLPDGFESSYVQLCDESHYVVPDFVRTNEPIGHMGVLASYELQRAQSIEAINATLERVARRDLFERRATALPEVLSQAILRSANEDLDDQRLVDDMLREFEELAQLTVDVRSDLASEQADIEQLEAEMQILAGVSQQLLGWVQQIEGQQKKKPQMSKVSVSQPEPVAPPHPSHSPRASGDVITEALSRSQMLEVAAESLELDVWTGPSISSHVSRGTARKLFQREVKEA